MAAGRSGLVLAVLTVVLAATAWLVVYALLAAQTNEEICIEGIQIRRVAAVMRARAALRTRGTLVREPATQREARAMVLFCDRAESPDVQELRDTALHATDPLAVSNALRALGRLGAMAGDVELAALLNDSRPRVRDETILALGESGGESSAALLRPLVRSEDPKTRTLAIRALSRLGGDTARAELHEVLADADATREERAFATAGLSALTR